MTREEALEKLYMLASEMKDDSIVLVSEVKILIDEIFDDVDDMGLEMKETGSR